MKRKEITVCSESRMQLVWLVRTVFMGIQLKGEGGKIIVGHLDHHKMFQFY